MWGYYHWIKRKHSTKVESFVNELLVPRKYISLESL